MLLLLPPPSSPNVSFLFLGFPAPLQHRVLDSLASVASVDAVRMTDECGISDPFLGTVDIYQEPGKAGVTKARFIKALPHLTPNPMWVAES